MSIGAFAIGATSIGGAQGGSPPLSVGAGLTLWVGAVERTAQMSQGGASVKFCSGICATAEIRLHDRDNTISIVPGEEVLIFLDGEQIFGGTVERARETMPSQSVNVLHKWIDLTAVDYGQTADRRLVSGVFEKQLAGDIIRTLVSRYLASDGITANGVEDGLEVGPITFEYTRCSAAIEAIAKLISYDWYIDEHRDLKFYNRAEAEAPFELSDQDSPREYQSIQIERSRREYRNTQIITGGTDVGSPRLETFAGDGETSTWNVELPIAADPVVEVSISGAAFVEQTLGIRGVDDESGSPYEFFWALGERAISQNRDSAPLTSADVVRVTYSPKLNIVVQASDPGAIEERKTVEGNSGLYEAMQTEARIESLELATQLADSLLRRHALITERVTVETMNTGIRPGQLQRIDLEPEGIHGLYLVTQADLVELGNGYYRIRYQLANNERPGGWPEFWRNLVQQGADFRISRGSTIRPISQYTSAVAVADSDESQAGDHLGGWESDPYSVLRIEVSSIGSSAHEGGIVYRTGPRIGEVRVP